MNARIKYDLDQFTDSDGLLCIRIVCRSKPGSSNHRDWTVGHAPIASARLVEFRRRMQLERSHRLLTVYERAKVCATIWESVRQSIQD